MCVWGGGGGWGGNFVRSVGDQTTTKVLSARAFLGVSPGRSKRSGESPSLSARKLGIL